MKWERQLAENRVSFAREEKTFRRGTVSSKVSSGRLNGMRTTRKIPGHWESLFW